MQNVRERHRERERGPPDHAELRGDNKLMDEGESSLVVPLLDAVASRSPVDRRRDTGTSISGASKSSSERTPGLLRERLLRASFGHK